MSAKNESPAHAALRAAGYTLDPVKLGILERWHRSIDGVDLIVVTAAPSDSVEMVAITPNAHLTIQIDDEDLVANRNEYERRALAAMRALRGEVNDE